MDLGTADHSPALIWDENIRRVLFLRLRAIGDTVLFTSCLEVLKRWRPELEIDVLMEPLGAPVLYGNPHMSHLYVIPRSGFSLPRYLQRAAVVAALRERRYDLAIDLRGWRTSMAVLRRCGARQTVMFEESEFSHAATLRVPDARAIWGKTPVVHDLERQLAVLKWLGTPVEEIPWPRVRVDPRADAVAARRLQELGLGERFAVLHVGASHPRKRWAPARFGQVADELWERHRLPSVIVALPSERGIAGAAAAARSRPSICTDLSLAETIALIARATVLLGNDSGLAHISGAVGTPTAVIFGPSDLRIWRLWTATPHRIIGRYIPKDERCTRCGKNDCRTALRCIDRITVEQVIAELDSLLAEILLPEISA